MFDWAKLAESITDVVRAAQETLIPIYYAIAGLLVGVLLGRDGGWFYGLSLGWLLGLWLDTRRRVDELQRRLDGLMTSVPAEQASLSAAADAIPEGREEVAEPAAVDPVPQMQDDMIARAEEADRQNVPPGGRLPAHLATVVAPVRQWLDDFLRGGNLLVKLGVIILFFGIAFLVKFAAERDVLPIELRLAGVALGGVVMLVLGWRLRQRRSGYALVLQGGALGVLYLTVFSSLRLYQLLPASLAFSILFVFAAFSAALAVLQNSRALAVLGVSGGFLAPVLTATGSGSHVALFSYYLVLNLGIFAIAWFKSWRLLNLTGFVFTFVVAAAWGRQYYSPAHLATTEPFLILFYLLYVAIAVLFAFRQPLRLRGYVDATLVFGVPLAGFGLQAAMVGDDEYGLAVSSLTLAAFYIALAALLWRRLGDSSRLLNEAFLALGVIFATLSIPFALDAQWTAAAWAMEGAAAVWVGTRQQRLLPRLLGYLLQFGGGLAYLHAPPVDRGGELLLRNGAYLGALVVALSGLFVAWLLHSRSASSVSPVRIPWLRRLSENSLAAPMLLWGLLWWFLAGFAEIEARLSWDRQVTACLLFMAASAAVAQWLSRRLRWPGMFGPAALLMPVLYLLLALLEITEGHPFPYGNLPAWLIAFAAHFWILYDREQHTGNPSSLLHLLGFWLLVLMLTMETAFRVGWWFPGNANWWLSATGLVPALSIFFLYHWGDRLGWPVAAHRYTYQYLALMPWVAGIWGWLLVANILFDGAAEPLPYLPLLNPLDLVLLAQLLVLTYWQRRPLDFEDWGDRHWRWRFSALGLAITAFAWRNGILLRSAHHYWGVAFHPGELLRSQLVQAGLSLLWAVTGLCCMLFAARRNHRPVWLAGALIMTAVVVKLFLVDLANSGTVERIVSFISVGLLLLLVGYFAPVPPAAKKEVGDE